MRYIRFLKTPRVVVEKSPSKAHVFCLVTITSDLGDSFLPYDVALTADLCSDPDCGAPDRAVWKTLIRQTIDWEAGMRSLAIKLPLKGLRVDWPARVHISANAKLKAENIEQLHDKRYRGVISAWSDLLNPEEGVRDAAKFVERRFGDEKVQICVWEETGESIARHLWYLL